MRLPSRSVLLVALAALVSSPAVSGEQVAQERERLLRQKILLVDSMLQGSPSTRAIAESDDPEARELLLQARELASIAEDKLARGELEAAGEGIDEALKMISSASAAVKKRGKSTLVQRARYKELSEGIDTFRQALGAELDPAIEALVAEAEGRTEADDYEGANRLLSRAYEETVSAVALARDKQTVVYSLRFETAADEYAYEVRRFDGNRMMVDLMLDKRKPGSLSELVNKYVGDAEGVRATAEADAAAGDYEGAVRKMEEAGQHLRRALGLLGIQV
jgi:hypothetical protein